jgi:Bifunctional DNA primase/polymerase, N-terminal
MNQKLTPTETKYLRILAKKHILLPTKNKKPLVKNWNIFYQETKTIEQLLSLNQEYSLRTGKLVGGGYYFIVLDLDDLWAKERIKDSRYVETNKGIHRYLLIKELPKSCWLVNKAGNKIGEIHSCGRFVVGIGSIHQQGTRYTLRGRTNEKWCLKFTALKELQAFLQTRNIFTTPWGKTGTENIGNLQPFSPKPKLTYQQKKTNLEQAVKNSKKKLHICYLCLAVFKLDQQIIKEHLTSAQHQQEWKNYQMRRKKKNLTN